MKTKSILIIILIFILGFLLGLFSAGLIQHAQMKKFRSIAEEKGFASHFIQVIKPSDEQLKQIDPILEKYNKKSILKGKQMRTEMRMTLDSLQLELEPYLTEKQKEILKNQKNRKRGFFRPFHRGRPPFHPNKRGQRSED
jgi:uncharacterized protein YneF (UPF0154 family)